MKLFPAKISERGNNAKKSRRQRVTISSYTTLQLRLVPRETVNFVSLVTSVYYCCDRCLLRHKTSTDNLVDCHPGSAIHQYLGCGMWDFFPLFFPSLSLVQLCLLSTEQNIYSDLVNDCLTEFSRSKQTS